MSENTSDASQNTASDSTTSLDRTAGKAKLEITPHYKAIENKASADPESKYCA